MSRDEKAVFNNETKILTDWDEPEDFGTDFTVD